MDIRIAFALSHDGAFEKKHFYLRKYMRLLKALK